MVCHRWLLVLLILLMLHQVGAAISVLDTPDEIADALSMAPWLQVALGGGWALIFAWSVLNLWRRRQRACVRALGLIVVFIAYSLLRWVLFVRADYEETYLPLHIILVALVVALAVGISGGIVFVRWRIDRGRQTDTGMSEQHEDQVI